MGCSLNRSQSSTSIYARVHIDTLIRENIDVRYASCDFFGPRNTKPNIANPIVMGVCDDFAQSAFTSARKASLAKRPPRARIDANTRDGIDDARRVPRRVAAIHSMHIYASKW